ncbi:hypothetical protein KLEP174_gp12 [Pseudomonas phage vB_PcuM_ KLEP17-4]|nr:hypothetical protein KLEP174_gp12 [Pseudomonas phage vB_PcuM_ KLEP17-4]
MMFNLLNAALTLIPSVGVMWSRTTGRTRNAVGQWVTQYAEPVALQVSFQPLEKAKYEALGLDLNKHYWVLYGSNPITAVERDTAGDLIDYNGRRCQAEDNIDWFDYNGWKGVIFVEIGQTPTNPEE